jgi:hypothetical protein
MVDVEIPDHQGGGGGTGESPLGGQGGETAVAGPGIVDIQNVQTGEVGPKKGRAPDLQFGDVHAVRKKYRKNRNMRHKGPQHKKSNAGLTAYRRGKKGKKTVSRRQPTSPNGGILQTNNGRNIRTKGIKKGKKQIPAPQAVVL